MNAEVPSANAAVLDLDLIRKYAVSGPRYTSYPPATKFAENPAASEVEEALARDNRDGAKGLSLYVHLPFCESRCWFCGCNTVITRRREAAAEYVDMLAREIGLTAARMDRRRPVTQIHLGGGTPTFLPPDQLKRLGALLWEHFPNRARDCEFGVEIDPRRLGAEHIEALREIGANRASLGVQDTDARVQLAIHRIQPQAQNVQAFSWLRERGFRSVNVDLIYGLPMQTPASFARTIADVMSLGPDRLSVFSYAHVPWIKPAQRIFEDRAQLPDAEAKLGMFVIAREALISAGYIDIGLDHFARPDDELAIALRNGSLQRNFQGYSTRGGSSLYAFGMSSISATADTYRQNFKTLHQWSAAVAAGRLPVERGLCLTEEDKRRRAIIMSLMCRRRLGFTEISCEIGVDFRFCYRDQLDGIADMVEDGLVRISDDCLEITPLGLPLLRVIAMRFDAGTTTEPRRHAAAV